MSASTRHPTAITPDVVRAAHEIRAGRYDGALPDVKDSGEEYDLVVVGGGFSGLSAAHHFRRLQPRGTVLVLDNHPIFGGHRRSTPTSLS